jgi:hypothetical protein
VRHVERLSTRIWLEPDIACQVASRSAMGPSGGDPSRPSGKCRLSLRLFFVSDRPSGCPFPSEIPTRRLTEDFSVDRRR